MDTVISNNRAPLQGRSEEWKQSHSRWIWWTYPLMGFVSFLIIGTKVKNYVWLAFGILYLAIMLALGLIVGDENLLGLSRRTLKSLDVPVKVAAVLYWVVTIVHAHLVKHDYLVRLDRMERAGQL